MVGAQTLGAIPGALRHPAWQGAPGRLAYVSSYALRAFNERLQAAELWLKSMEAHNEEHDITLSLADAVASSIANPANRRDELVVRARGFSDAADEMGYVGLFFTWTAPSQYHP